MKFKVKIIDDQTEKDRMLNDLFTTIVRKKYVEIGEEKFVMPICFNDNWQTINKFEVRDDDVYITGHMKSGTTWLHEIVDLIVCGVSSRYINTNRLARQLFLDYPLIYNFEDTNLGLPYSIEYVKEAKSPRCIKSHLPWLLLPEQIQNETRSPKIIHILRNPKDTCVSFYHYSKYADGFKGDFKQFCKLFLGGRLHYGPYFANVKSYWKKKDNPNILFVKYSDLKRDLPGMINKIASFLNKILTEKDVQELVEFVSIDSMRKHIGKEMDECINFWKKQYNTRNESSQFIREGKEGDHTTLMTEELIQVFDNHTKKALAGTDLSF